MKLLNKKEFLKLPEGTVYFEKVKAENACYFGHLFIKGETLQPDDYYEIDLISPDLSPNSHSEGYECFDKLNKGETLNIDFNYGGRNGLYDDTDMYYVLDKEDVKSLIDVITEAYNSYK